MIYEQFSPGISIILMVCLNLVLLGNIYYNSLFQNGSLILNIGFIITIFNYLFLGFKLIQNTEKNLKNKRALKNSVIDIELNKT